MSQVSLRRTIPHLGPLQIAIMLLALVTGSVHLYRALLMTFLAGPRPGHVPGPPPGSFGGPSPLMQLVFTALPVLFYLNFIGYVVLAGALYLPKRLLAVPDSSDNRTKRGRYPTEQAGLQQEGLPRLGLR